MIPALAMRPVLCPVLVGREAETRLLAAAIASARSGNGRTVLLVGEAGLGKSRLTRQAAETAREQGLAVLIGRAVSGGTPTPFRLHWADGETLALVEYLADNLAAEPVLCLGTFRPDGGHDAAELAAKLEGRGPADMVRIGPLGPGAMAVMTRACLGADGVAWRRWPT